MALVSKPKLELTWIDKDKRSKLEPRVLVHDSELSYHAKKRDGIAQFDNRLIFGDNLLGLKALEQEFAGKVKCVYIDPPYNTGSAFSDYDDGLEHSLWLSMMKPRLELLQRFLTEDGSIFIQIDDNEGHYLKLLADEVFGRKNFVTCFIWQKVDSPNDNKVSITPDHEYILCYARDNEKVRFHQMKDPSLLEAYRGPDTSGRMYRDRLLKKNGKNSLREDRPSMFFSIPGPDGADVWPIHDDGKEACWAHGKASVMKMLASNELIWRDRGTEGKPLWTPYTREFAPENPVRPYPTIWTDVLTSRQAKAHQKDLLPEAPLFSTPKPEQLLERILEMATSEGDLVLDSFAGSGTTGAVAHKMGRRWIMIEMGEHCHTHIIPRLKKVINGTDQGGISQALGWKGGGGFRYYRLASSLIKKDAWGNEIINPDYNPEMVAEAVCKLEGFTYAPSETEFWRQGYSTENDFIYVTTQTLTVEQLERIGDEVGPKSSLLICCGAFRVKDPDRFTNLTLKKIPKTVLDKCEWDKDDYSLKISQLPIVENEPDEEENAPKTSKREMKAKGIRQGGLFDEVPVKVKKDKSKS